MAVIMMINTCSNNGVAMDNNDVKMSNNDLLVPECCFAWALARAGLHIGTWFCFVSFIANRDAAGMPRNPGSHALNEVALQAGWWLWTSCSHGGLGVHRPLPARPPPRTSHLHTCAKVSSAARARRVHRAPHVRHQV